MEERLRNSEARVQELEQHVRDQHDQLQAAARRATFKGAADHLSLTIGRARQAVSTLITNVFGSSYAEDYSRLDEQSTRSAAFTKKNMKRRPSIPNWDSTTDKHVKKNSHLTHSWAYAGVDAGGDHLEDHEFVREDEWNEAGTTVINPKSRWKETWDLGVLVFILYSAIVVPFRICFSAEAVGNMWYVEVGISLFFIADVIFNFNTAFAIEDKWVISRERIVYRYLSGKLVCISRANHMLPPPLPSTQDKTAYSCPQFCGCRLVLDRCTFLTTSRTDYLFCQ
jgi:hypothetical protein